MEKEAQDLLSWLDGATKYQLPSYEELPHVPLYMEQVVGYINDILAPLTDPWRPSWNTSSRTTCGL